MFEMFERIAIHMDIHIHTQYTYILYGDTYGYIYICVCWGNISDVVLCCVPIPWRLLLD